MLKKLLLFWLIMFFVSLLVLSISCDTGPTGTRKHPLVGAWEWTKLTMVRPDTTEILTPEETGIEMTWVFKSNHEAVLTQEIEGEPSSTYATWSTSGDTLTLTLTEDGSGQVLEFEYLIAGNKLIMSLTLDLSSFVYEFVRQRFFDF